MSEKTKIRSLLVAFIAKCPIESNPITVLLFPISNLMVISLTPIKHCLVPGFHIFCFKYMFICFKSFSTANSTLVY